MDTITETVETATFATRAQVIKAVASDAVTWVVPFIVAALIVAFVPFVAASLLIAVTLWTLAFAVAFVSFMVDVNSLARYGYTESLRKRGLRVIDPAADVLIYKARLVRKSIFGVLAGRYEVIAL